jgi:hypothetical protein
MSREGFFAGSGCQHSTLLLAWLSWFEEKNDKVSKNKGKYEYS